MICCIQPRSMVLSPHNRLPQFSTPFSRNPHFGKEKCIISSDPNVTAALNIFKVGFLLCPNSFKYFLLVFISSSFLPSPPVESSPQGPPATGRYLRGRALGRCDRHEEAVADLMATPPAGIFAVRVIFDCHEVIVRCWMEVSHQVSTGRFIIKKVQPPGSTLEPKAWPIQP